MESHLVDRIAFLFIAHVLLWTQNVGLVHGDDCIYIECGNYEYCCGQDICCTDWGAMWFVWFIIIVVIISLITCCGCFRARRARERAGVIIVQGQATNTTVPRPGYTYSQTTVTHPQQPVPYQYYQPSHYGAVQHAAPIQYQTVHQQAGPPPYYQHEYKDPSAPFQ